MPGTRLGPGATALKMSINEAHEREVQGTGLGNRRTKHWDFS